MPPKKDITQILKISNGKKEEAEQKKKELKEKLILGKKSKLPTK